MVGGSVAPVDAVVDLPAEARSASRARRFVIDTLDGLGRSDIEDVATLLVSELVTNALLHARTQLTVRVQVVGDGVRFDVVDGSPVPPAVRRFSSAESATGRGLALVERLATAWGVEPTGPGKCVWFRLDAVRPGWAPVGDPGAEL